MLRLLLSNEIESSSSPASLITNVLQAETISWRETLIKKTKILQTKCEVFNVFGQRLANILFIYHESSARFIGSFGQMLINTPMPCHVSGPFVTDQPLWSLNFLKTLGFPCLVDFILQFATLILTLLPSPPSNNFIAPRYSNVVRLVILRDLRWTPMSNLFRFKSFSHRPQPFRSREIRIGFWWCGNQFGPIKCHILLLYGYVTRSIWGNLPIRLDGSIIAVILERKIPKDGWSKSFRNWFMSCWVLAMCVSDRPCFKRAADVLNKLIRLWG